MSYLLDRKNKNKKIRNIFFIVLFLFIFVYFNSFIFNKISYLSHLIFKPTFVLGNNIKYRFENFSSYFLSKENLLKENNNLKNEKNELLAKFSNYDYLKTENEELKKLLDREGEQKDFIVSAILAKPNISLFDSLIIDIGKDTGIKVGDLVFAYKNIPIGKISHIYENSSKVVLFTNNKEETTGIIADKNIYVNLIGRGGGNFEIILPRDLILEKGSNIILPGINPYLLAKVETIISDPRDSSQRALLVSPVNIQELKFVEVELK